MAGSLRRMRLWHSALALTLFVPVAYGECVNPIVTPTECDFKNEDTHLWLNQPGWKLNENKKIANLFESASQTIDQYLATVKTVGDANVGGINLAARMDIIAAEIGTAVTASMAGTAVLAGNDPWDLKTLYLDVTRCEIFWDTVYGETCPSTAELPTALLGLTKLSDLADKIRDIKNTPNVILGEEWGAIREDFGAIRATFNSAKTLGSNLDTATKLSEFDRRFSNFGDMLSKPRLTIDRWTTERAEISETVNDTIRDTMKSMHELSQTTAPSADGTPRTRDSEEVFALSDMSRRAVGRMQSMEIDNMSKNHTAQIWTKLVEHQVNVGNMIAADYADELQVTNTGRVVDIQRLTPDPLNPTIIGNEAPLPRP